MLTRKTDELAEAFLRPCDWEMGRQLAVGSYGSVHLVSRLGIKSVMKRRLSGNYDEMYEREIDALELFRPHPNVVQLLASDPSRFVMEFCPGGSMAHVVGKWNDDRCRKASRELLEAIRYVHSAGWLHRDISPQNVFLMADGVVKLGDFGFARPKERLMSAMVVTLWYRHEVLLRADGSRSCTYDERVDVFAAACVISELVTGIAQFQGKTPKHQLKLVTRATQKWEVPFAEFLSKKTHLDMGVFMHSWLTISLPNVDVQ